MKELKDSFEQTMQAREPMDVPAFLENVANIEGLKIG